MSKTTTAQEDLDRLLGVLDGVMDDIDKGARGHLIPAFMDSAKGDWFDETFGSLMAAVNGAHLNSARRRAQAILNQEEGR